LAACAPCAAALLLALALAACGQKGPLFLPAQAGSAAKPVERAPSAAEGVRPAASAQAASSPGLPDAAR